MATTVIKDIFVGDIGTRFICEMTNLVNSEPEAPLNVSAAIEMVVVFKTPSGEEKEFPGTHVTNGEDGLIYYKTANKSDLDAVGNWEYYGWVQYPDGERRGSSIKFKVYEGRQSEQTP